MVVILNKSFHNEDWVAVNEDIWKVIADMGIELHPDRINAIAEQLSNISSVNEFFNARSNFGWMANKSIMLALEKAWAQKPEISSLEIAAALRGASKTASIMENREAIEMVWTGPFTGLVSCRHTEQVLLEVIDSARWRLFIVSFVTYDIESIKKALQDAAGRNVEINILLESSKLQGGKINFDSLASFREMIPSANLYEWNPGSKFIEQKNWLNGAVHAKCAVADGKLAFITSANLTRAAMENNMELGVLIRGGKLPEKLEHHLEALKVIGVIGKT